jgi:BlaI family penicillinase repressor
MRISLDKNPAMLKNQHMMKPKLTDSLSRRERQVMNILFRRGEATVAEVMADLPDPPTYSAVRSILRILAEKKLISHREDGPRYVYLPAVNPDRAADEALNQVVKTFFDGSAEAAVTALLRLSDAELGEDEIAKLRDRIKKARVSGR